MHLLNAVFMLQKIVVRDILAEKNSQSFVSTQFGV